MPLTSASRVVLSDDQVFTTLGDESVILGLRDGVYYGLDAVGARVWDLLAEPRRVSEVVDVLLDEFDVERAQCERDVLSLLETLASKSLIREVSDAAEGAL